MKIKSVAIDYGIVDAKDIKKLIEIYGLDREKLHEAIKRLDLSQQLHIITDVGDIKISFSYEIKDMVIVASPQVREAIAKEK